MTLTVTSHLPLPFRRDKPTRYSDTKKDKIECNNVTANIEKKLCKDRTETQVKILHQKQLHYYRAQFDI